MYTLKSEDNYQKVRGVRLEQIMYVLLEYISKFVITITTPIPMYLVSGGSAPLLS